MIYLDWAATAPLSACAAQAMKPLIEPGLSGLEQGNANANALYGIGRNAFKQLEQARKDIAQALGASRPSEIIFTSGATESCNAALFGLVDALMLKKEQEGDHDCVPEVVISSLEHGAVKNAARVLNQWGAYVRVVHPDKNGHIHPEALEKELSEHTILVSIMAVNNEIGSVMDIPRLCEIAHDCGALFHTDATQAIGKLALSVSEWNVDAFSCSSHKVGGPKGVGALYLKNRTPFSPQIVGGGQEFNQRSGTQNVAGAVGFAAALVEACEEQPKEAKRLSDLRDYCYQQLCLLPLVEPSVDLDALSTGFAPHIVSVTVKGFESETLILRLDNQGIGISGGSACSSHSLEPSEVLREIGMSRDRALTSLRVSFGKDTTKADVDALIQALKTLIA